MQRNTINIAAVPHRLRPHPGKLQVQAEDQAGASPVRADAGLHQRDKQGGDKRQGRFQQV